MNVNEAIVRRRAIRNFASTPIPDDVLQEILEAARWAPSGGNGQNCRFGVVTDETKKKELAQAAGDQMWIASAPVVIALCSQISYNTADLQEDDFSLTVNRLRFGERLLRHLEICEDRRGIGLLWANSCPLIPGTHMTLAAASFGLDTCWVGYLDVARASEILNLPGDYACLYLLPIGYAAAEPETRTSRIPLAELTFYNTWEAKR